MVCTHYINFFAEVQPVSKQNKNNFQTPAVYHLANKHLFSQLAVQTGVLKEEQVGCGHKLQGSILVCRGFTTG